MRTRTLATAFILVAASASFGSAFQERIKPKGKADFGSLHSAVSKHFNAGHFGKAYAAAKELMTVISASRAVAIRESLPAAPPEYNKEPYKEPKNAAMQNNALFAVAAGVGNLVEQKYNGPGGRIQVTVTADSPFVQMFSMMLSNPAMVGENQELIKYGDIMAMLEAQGKRKTLKFMIGSSMVEAQFANHSDDFIFAMFDQNAVDVIAAAISN